VRKVRTLANLAARANTSPKPHRASIAANARNVPARNGPAKNAHVRTAHAKNAHVRIAHATIARATLPQLMRAPLRTGSKVLSIRLTIAHRSPKARLPSSPQKIRLSAKPAARADCARGEKIGLRARLALRRMIAIMPIRTAPAMRRGLIPPFCRRRSLSSAKTALRPRLKSPRSPPRAAAPCAARARRLMMQVELSKH
jgi:hypothetical protein